MPVSFGLFISYGLLTLTLLWLWFPRACPWRENSPCWQAPALAASISALYFVVIQPLAILWIALLWWLCLGLRRTGLAPWQRHGALVGVIVMALALGTHQLPGFVAHETLPGLSSLHFDKAIVGLLLLAYGPPLLARWHECWPLMKTTAIVALVTVPALLALALALGVLRYQGATTTQSVTVLLLWAWANLCITVVAEEAFFRGLIQARLALAFSRWRYGPYLALLLAAAAFGLAHSAGGILYVLLAGLGGLAYGLVYHLTGRIEASILLHFALNLVQRVYFT